jgi:hypothetical protein
MYDPSPGKGCWHWCIMIVSTSHGVLEFKGFLEFSISHGIYLQQEFSWKILDCYGNVLLSDQLLCNIVLRDSAIFYELASVNQ